MSRNIFACERAQKKGGSFIYRVLPDFFFFGYTINIEIIARRLERLFLARDVFIYLFFFFFIIRVDKVPRQKR